MEQKLVGRQVFVYMGLFCLLLCDKPKNKDSISDALKDETIQAKQEQLLEPLEQNSLSKRIKKNHYYVKSSGLKVWSAPYFKGKKIGLLENSEAVKILQTSPKEAALNGKKGYWVEIETIPDEVIYLEEEIEEQVVLTGWVFDAFLAQYKEGPIYLLEQARKKESLGDYQKSLQIYKILKENFPLKLVYRGESVVRIMDIVNNRQDVLACKANAWQKHSRYTSTDLLLKNIIKALETKSQENLQKLVSCDMHIGFCEACSYCGIQPKKSVAYIQKSIAQLELSTNRISLSSPNFIKYAFFSKQNSGEFVLTLQKNNSQQWQWVGFCYLPAGAI
ncbi:MAG: hypothetical protein AAF518_09160 [Spirochaetota bacterium]